MHRYNESKMYTHLSGFCSHFQCGAFLLQIRCHIPRYFPGYEGLQCIPVQGGEPAVPRTIPYHYGRWNGSSFIW